eukprot:NODE_568_length_6607_cov_0.144130.p4 type:complete len:116 gc:universal NODE_568_length_6607_cov_0.144130:3984-4331(+)
MNLYIAVSVASPRTSPFLPITTLLFSAHAKINGSSKLTMLYNCSPSFSFVLYMILDCQMLTTVILFRVIVPVLSLHIKVTAPSVSKPSMSLTRTFFLTNLFAANVSINVTVAGNP